MTKLSETFTKIDEQNSFICKVTKHLHAYTGDRSLQLSAAAKELLLSFKNVLVRFDGSYQRLCEFSKKSNVTPHYAEDGSLVGTSYVSVSGITVLTLYVNFDFRGKLTNVLEMQLKLPSYIAEKISANFDHLQYIYLCKTVFADARKYSLMVASTANKYGNPQALLDLYQEEFQPIFFAGKETYVDFNVEQPSAMIAGHKLFVYVPAVNND